jgi:hypothetical protein
MSPRERLELLLGDGADEDLLDDPDAVADRVVNELGVDVVPGDRVEQILVEVVAKQILADDPPEVWTAAQRLLAAGQDRARVLRQLVLALIDPLERSLATESDFSVEDYRDRLAALPLPDHAEIIDRITVALSRRAVPAGELVAAVIEHFDLTDSEGFVDLVERMLDMGVEIGQLAYVAGDLVVDIDALLASVVLTHRLTETECEIGLLNASFDLPTLDRPEALRFGDHDLERFNVARGDLLVAGPDGWLSEYDAGTVVAVTVDPDGTVTIAPAEPEPDETVAVLIGTALDAEYAEPGLPVRAEELLLSVLARDPDAFSSAHVPLTELAVTHGWMVRAGEAGPDEEAWDHAATVRSIYRLGDRIASPALATVVAALAVDASDDDLRAFLPLLDDLEITAHYAEELSGEPDLRGVEREANPERPPPPAWARSRADRLVELAVDDRAATAGGRLVAALLAERGHEPHVAEAHLVLAHEADRHRPDVVDRLAWCAADRGDAATAVRLWRTLDADGPHITDLAEAAELARAPADAPRRNDPCWCGSGRKFKQCHLGRPAPRPLAARVPWLMRKAVAYLERRGALADAIVVELASIVADDDDETLREVFATPIPIDLALTEGGWFEEFLTDRGALLPDDEGLLARAWAHIERTVYEVEAVTSGADLTLRDLRTGDVVVVTERRFSREASPRQLICARVVPDGVGHQLIGAVIPVAAGTELTLLDLLDRADHYELAEWCAARMRPPEVRTREGEVLARFGSQPLSYEADATSHPGVDLSAAEDDEVLTEFIARYEEEWCDAPVPALGGMTPREVAADPTRREELERLLADFDRLPGPMHPDRMRALLGLG